VPFTAAAVLFKAAGGGGAAAIVVLLMTVVFPAAIAAMAVALPVAPCVRVTVDRTVVGGRLVVLVTVCPLTIWVIVVSLPGDVSWIMMISTPPALGGGCVSLWYCDMSFLSDIFGVRGSSRSWIMR